MPTKPVEETRKSWQAGDVDASSSNVTEAAGLTAPAIGNSAKKQYWVWYARVLGPLHWDRQRELVGPFGRRWCTGCNEGAYLLVGLLFVLICPAV